MCEPVCYECGTEMEMGPRGFWRCTNCGVDFETDYMRALADMEELLDGHDLDA